MSILLFDAKRKKPPETQTWEQVKLNWKASAMLGQVSKQADLK